MLRFHSLILLKDIFLFLHFCIHFFSTIKSWINLEIVCYAKKEEFLSSSKLKFFVQKEGFKFKRKNFFLLHPPSFAFILHAISHSDMKEWRKKVKSCVIYFTYHNIIAQKMLSRYLCINYATISSFLSFYFFLLLACEILKKYDKKQFLPPFLWLFCFFFAVVS